MTITDVKPMKCQFATEGVLKIERIAAGIGIIVYSMPNNLAAGIHVLRGQASSDNPENPAYYANTGLAHIFKEFKSRGASPPFSIAIAGGSSLLSKNGAAGSESALAKAVKHVLAGFRMKAKIDKTGGSQVRTMVLDLDQRKIKID